METLGSPALEYARQLTAVFAEALDGALMAAYLHGSGAMGGWLVERSDIDLLFVTEREITREEIDRLAAAANSLPCPGTGVELSIVRAPVALPEGPPPFEVHLCTGAGAKVVAGAGHPGDADLVMHFAGCLARGIRVFGPVAEALLPPVPWRRMLNALLDELDWAASEAPGHYAVLNACRAAAFAETGGILSKLEGSEWAARTGFHLRMAQDAWALQQTGRRPTLDASAVNAVVRDARDLLRVWLEREA